MWFWKSFPMKYLNVLKWSRHDKLLYNNNLIPLLLFSSSSFCTNKMVFEFLKEEVFHCGNSLVVFVSFQEYSFEYEQFFFIQWLCPSQKNSFLKMVFSCENFLEIQFICKCVSSVCHLSVGCHTMESWLVTIIFMYSKRKMAKQQTKQLALK